jgi:tRNA(Leu) C34 or U34 (ribose-2'-O)-methylase TrmL
MAATNLGAIVKRPTLECGLDPAVVLWNPKYAHNLAGAIRAASCFDVRQVWWAGNRLDTVLGGLDRLPREERMKGYADVAWGHSYAPLDRFDREVTPVAVEKRDRAECLTDFVHPDRAVYVFGPEDGSLPKAVLHACHRFVWIPSEQCLNLAAAVNVVLCHRRISRQLAGLEPRIVLAETRGYARAIDVAGWDGR